MKLDRTRNLYLKWVLANTIGGTIGYIGLFIVFILGFLIPFIPLVAGLLLGVLWGFAQWFVLRKYVPIHWMLAVAMGIGIPWFAFVLISYIFLFVYLLMLAKFAISWQLELASIIVPLIITIVA